MSNGEKHGGKNGQTAVPLHLPLTCFRPAINHSLQPLILLRKPLETKGSNMTCNKFSHVSILLPPDLYCLQFIFLERSLLCAFTLVISVSMWSILFCRISCIVILCKWVPVVFPLTQFNWQKYFKSVLLDVIYSNRLPLFLITNWILSSRVV